MLYIFTQVSRKWPRKTLQMECSATLPQPAPPQPGISPTLSWTDADSLTLEQICKDLGISETELNPCMPQTPVQFPTDVKQMPESRASKAAVCPWKTRITSKKATVKPILGRINAPRLPNGRYQKLQPPALPERSSSDCPSLTICSTDAAATWTSPMMSSSSTTPSSSNLASLIYSTFILDHLTSNTNFELNLHKNLFRQFYYPQLISFLDNALSSQPHSYKSLDSVIFLRFVSLDFNKFYFKMDPLYGQLNLGLN